MKFGCPIVPVLLACSLACGVAARTLGFGGDVDLTSPLKGVSFQRTAGMRAPAEDVPATHFQTIKPFKGNIAGRSAADALRSAGARVPGSGYQNITALTEHSTQYAIEMIWDDQPIWVLFDTGSSDTWAVKSNYSCLSRFGNMQPSPNACSWGPNFIDEFRYGEHPDLHFAVTFGSGESVSGPLGSSDITVAGITVEQQLVGLANSTYWYGNNVTNGILGLAYPTLTSAYSGPVGDERYGYKQDYQPFFTSMVSQGLVDAYFAIAIERDSSNGMIGWGGLPPVEWSAAATAYTDIIIASIVPGAEEDVASFKHTFYTIAVDGFQWGQTTDMNKYLYIVDTGTTLMYLPPPLAEAIANSFEPRATYLFQYGGYFAPCDAVAPRVAVIIDGARFWIDPTDLIFRTLQDPLSGLCMLGISSGGYGPYILGSVFLQNVLAVFDVGAAQMRFYSRK